MSIDRLTMLEQTIRNQSSFLEELSAYVRSLQSSAADQEKAALEAKLTAGTSGAVVRLGEIMPPSGTTAVQSTDNPAISLGNTTPFIGEQNQLYDPTFEALTNFGGAYNDTISVINTSWSNLGPTVEGDTTGDLAHAIWVAMRSGSVTRTDLRTVPRTHTASGPFNSATLEWQLQPSTNGQPLSMSIREWQGISNTGRRPFLVAQVKLLSAANGWGSWVTKAEATLQIVRKNALTEVESVVATTTVKLKEVMPAGQQTFNLSAATLIDPAWLAGDHFYWQMTVEVIQTSTSYTFFLNAGEPMLSWAASPDPQPYSPIVANWIPEQVVHHGGVGVNGIGRYVVAGHKKKRSTPSYGLTNEGVHHWYTTATAQTYLATTLEQFADGHLLSSGDVLTSYNADYAVSYNADGTVASVTRTHDASTKIAPLVVNVSWSSGKVTSVVGSHYGVNSLSGSPVKTVTVTPTYTADRVTSFTRRVT